MCVCARARAPLSRYHGPSVQLFSEVFIKNNRLCFKWTRSITVVLNKRNIGNDERQTHDGVRHVAQFFCIRVFYVLFSTSESSTCLKMHCRAGKALTRLQQKRRLRVARPQWGVNVVMAPSQHAAAVVWWGRCSPFKFCLSPPVGQFLCYLHF